MWTRGGSVESIFVATQEQIDSIIGKRVYFGEILGKHSEVIGDLESCEFEVLSEDQDFIEKFEKIIGDTGHNPISYLRDQEQ